MNFQQADQVFRHLTRQYHEKKISIAVYREKVNELLVTDSRGAVWKPQAFTGVWHVQKEGQWVAARPPGYTPAAQKAPPKKSRGKIFAIFAGLGSLGVIALCVLTIGAGVLLWFTPDLMDWVSQEAESWGFVVDSETSGMFSSSSESMEIVSTLRIPADSNRHTDEHGVSLVVPSEALEEGSEQIVMNAYSLPREINDEISEAFNIESLMYEVGVEGEMDGAGKAELEFPFQGSDAVLMVVIDNEYYGFIEQTPENGIVKVHAHLGNMESGEITQAYYGDEENVAESIRYVLLSPKSEVGQNEGFQPVAYLPSSRQSENLFSVDMYDGKREIQARDPQDCSYTSSGGFVQPAIKNGCRTNLEKSVIVKWTEKYSDITGKPQGIDFTQQEADNLINVAESIIDRYYDAGFTNAKIKSQWFGYALSIVVTPTGDPTYNFKNGVLYLPASAAKGYSADNPPVDLMHELAHWIQHKKYSFVRASISGSSRWWLEVSAENMVFIIEPKNIDSNLNIYRVMNGFEKAPFTWAMFGEQDEYVHAHLLWVSMCSNLGVCPLDQEQFKQAINTGIYPFSDATRQNLLVNNLDDYALYLLNHPPRTSNLSAVTNIRMGLSGDSRVGGLVNVGVGGDVNLKFNGWGNEQHFYDGNDGPANTPSMRIDAQIEKGGVYPFTISSGDLRRSSLPVALVIEPGPPFWLKIGDAEPVRYDGDQQYTIQPISKTFGEEVVRIIALGDGDENRFQAQAALIDLQGDWMITDPEPVSLNHNCEAKLEESDIYFLVDRLSHHFAARGSYVYQQEETGLSLVFEPEEGHALSEVIYIRIPPDPDDPEDVEERIPYNTTYAGKISLTPDSIEWTMDMNMTVIKSEDGSQLVPENQRLSGFQGWEAILILMLLLVALPGGLLLASKDNLRLRRILLLIMILNLVSLACITEMIFNSNVKLDKIEYTRPIEVPLVVDDTPIFRLSGGQIVTNLSLTYEDISDIEFDSDTWGFEGESKPKTCTIEVVSKDDVRVYQNGYWRDFNMFDELLNTYD